MAETRRPSACTKPFIVAVTGLALMLAYRGTLMAQTSSAAAVPVSVHIGNASGIAPACAASGVSHIFLTVTDIQAHQSGKGIAGWHDLTPDMPAGGVQVDLLTPGEQFEEPTECFLTDVDGGTGGLPPGKYQQFRISLLTNGTSSAGPSDNACASPLGNNIFNCVESNGTFQPLAVPNETIKIPSSQITRGGLTISAAQGGIDLDIDINGCASIVVKTNKRRGVTAFALRPVLHSGEIELKPLIAGKVVLGAEASGTVSAVSPTTAISGAAVALEQRSTNNFVEGTPAPGAGATPSVNLEGVVAVTQTDSNGHFVFCPIPLGTYDIVAGSEAMPSMGNAADATITTSAIVNANGGPNGLVIPLLAGSGPAVTLGAQLTSRGASSATSALIGFRAAQTVTTGVEAQIVEYSATSLGPVPTSSDSTGSCSGNQCPAGTDCACVSLGVPSDNPVIGPVGGPYAAPGASPALYSVAAMASTCSPMNLITVPEAAPLPTPTLSFVNCQ